jgi:hypothetical protein
VKTFVYSTVVLSVLCTSLPAQEQVAPWNNRERLIAVVPMIGTGTAADPKRPLFAPKPGERSPFEGFSFELSDDGKFAIVEFTAAHPDVFKVLLADARVNKAFRKGRHSRAELERELKVFKRELKLERLLGGVIR